MRSATSSPCSAGCADDAAAHRTLRALARAGVHEPYPVRTVCDPIEPGSALWRPYMSRHRQNLAWQYHNGGVWPFVGGFWVAALARRGDGATAAGRERVQARARERVARLAVQRMAGTAARSRRAACPASRWNAAAFLIACDALEGDRLFGALPRERRRPAGA